MYKLIFEEDAVTSEVWETGSFEEAKSILKEVLLERNYPVSAITHVFEEGKSYITDDNNGFSDIICYDKYDDSLHLELVRGHECYTIIPTD